MYFVQEGGGRGTASARQIHGSNNGTGGNDINGVVCFRQRLIAYGADEETASELDEKDDFTSDLTIIPQLDRAVWRTLFWYEQSSIYEAGREFLKRGLLTEFMKSFNFERTRMLALVVASTPSHPCYTLKYTALRPLRRGMQFTQ
ncbi:unnamed protein product [Thelazia callipaeda]|uniref:LisH domain-containing protein n=1 Tax=Thelazia callipaeda TaxID=103827 RepID=A0A0N5CZ48_THECL|nr:unnamed protein product [Thelazia callipaeda]